MRNLSGKVAVVTGAASGIGRALAAALAEQGCDVALVDVDPSGLEETATSVLRRGRKVSLHEFDVSDRAQMQELPAAVLAEHGVVDLLINNAGVAAGYSFENHPIEGFERVIGVNFMGVVYGCKFFLPHLKERPEAHIVNVSSLFGLIGVPGHAAYCASKFAVRGLSEVLWGELSKSSVGVTCVHPGGVRTNIVRSAPGWGQGAETTHAQFQSVVRRTPERAAQVIVRAIQRKKPRVRLGFETYLTDWLVRLFPKTATRFPPAVGEPPPPGAPPKT